jgi:mannosyltransferase
MIIIDGIIFSLQKSGGISVYFDELLRYLSRQPEEVFHLLYENESSYTKELRVIKTFVGV